MKKLLILDASSLQAMAVAKYVKKYSDFYTVGAINIDYRFNKRYYDEILIEEYDKILSKSFDYILPTGAISTYEVLHKQKNLYFCNGIFFSDRNLVAYDKEKMLKIVKDINIPTPDTYYSRNDISSYPVFYKSAFEQGYSNLGVAYSFADTPEGDLIYQEYINTKYTYGVGFIAKKGEIISYIVHKEVISYPKNGGSAVVVEIFYDDRLLEYTSKVIKKLDYNGWGLAEYKYCLKRDDYVFMEVNAKLWASIELMLANNPNFLKLLLNIEYHRVIKERILFINRLLRYSFFDTIRFMPYIFSSKVIVEQSLLYQLLRKLIPNSLVKYLKKVLR